MMSFLNVLTVAKDVFPEIIIGKLETPEQENKILLESQKEKPEELLRTAGFKIKMITPTSFGTQIDFAKQYDEKDIEIILKAFQIKIKNKSVFIIE